jgi:membrane associated rhomboid family serine protease
MERSVERVRAREQDFFTGAVVVAGLLAVMWIVEVVNALDNQRLSEDGIISQRLSGLPGILSAPFLHTGFSHLIANSVPFAILGLLIALGGPVQVVAVTVIAALVSGLGAWGLSGAGTDTVGASGVVFGYATYLISRGLFDRRVGEVLLGIVVLLLFGGALISDLIPRSGISWEAHLFGGIGGVIAAAVLARSARARPSAAGAMSLPASLR